MSKSRSVNTPWLFAGLTVFLLGMTQEAWSQQRRDGALDRGVIDETSVRNSGAPRLTLPSEGFWARVLTTSTDWIVIQNDEGQQFPIDPTRIELFVIRQPIAPNQISPSALAEIAGLDVGTSIVRTQHIDVYEGSMRGLVRPSYTTTVGDLRDVDSFNLNGYHFMSFPSLAVYSGAFRVPRQVYLVGPVQSSDPQGMRIEIPGNNAIIVPFDTVQSITRIEPGSSQRIQRGDLAFVIPTDADSKSLRLTQLVVYRTSGPLRGGDRVPVENRPEPERPRNNDR